MLRDFLLFVAALWREWKALLTGGSIIAFEALWVLSGKPPLPQTANWIIVGLTMILASFLAWRRQWMEADKDFVHLSLAELRDLSRIGTALHTKTVLKPYIGKRIRVTGTIRNAFPAATLAFVKLTCDGVEVSLELPFWGLKPFAPLPKGTSITVVGRISEIT